MCLNKLEHLYEIATNEDIEVLDYNFKSDSIKGLYCDKTIALSTKLENLTEKCCVLAEELGHYYTTVGNILDQSNENNRKQERKARAWGYNRLVNIERLVEACKQGCRNAHEISEYLDITEEFLNDALKYFKSKYGAYYTIGQYTIYFNDFGYYVDMK